MSSHDRRAGQEPRDPVHTQDEFQHLVKFKTSRDDAASKFQVSDQQI